MSPCTELSGHINEFNKLILIRRILKSRLKKRLALYVTTSLHHLENFVRPCCNGMEFLDKNEDVLATRNSRERGHLKRDCLMKKSSGFIKKGKHDQDSDSSDDEGNAYFGEALVVVGNDEMTEIEYTVEDADGRIKVIKVDVMMT
ncbi:hypothetical protein Tco_0733254 [Tanacetum coccineum]